MAKYFYAPFGVSGTRVTIPDPVQSDGSVSYTAGFPVDYEKKLGVDSDAKAIPRSAFNELIYETQLAIQQYQQFGCPDFITTSDNLGSPFSYGINAFVRYDDGGGFKVYQSIAASNTALPTDATKWSVVNPGSNDPQTSEGVWALDTGAANAYVAAPSPAYTAYAAGTYVRVVMATANTTASTLNINGIGPVNIILRTGLSLAGGEIRAGMVGEFFHNGTAWVLLNPYTYIETGSNADGHWKKYPDGTIEQWGVVVLGTSITDSKAVTFNFPIPFTSANEGVVATAIGKPNGTFGHVSTQTLLDTGTPLVNYTIYVDTGDPTKVISDSLSASWRASGR
jgi:hypothetical protein